MFVNVKQDFDIKLAQNEGSLHKTQWRSKKCVKGNYGMKFIKCNFNEPSFRSTKKRRPTFELTRF